MNMRIWFFLLQYNLCREKIEPPHHTWYKGNNHPPAKPEVFQIPPQRGSDYKQRLERRNNTDAATGLLRLVCQLTRGTGQYRPMSFDLTFCPLPTDVLYNLLSSAYSFLLYQHNILYTKIDDFHREIFDPLTKSVSIFDYLREASRKSEGAN